MLTDIGEKPKFLWSHATTVKRSVPHLQVLEERLSWVFWKLHVQLWHLVRCFIPELDNQATLSTVKLKKQVNAVPAEHSSTLCPALKPGCCTLLFKIEFTKLKDILLTREMEDSESYLLFACKLRQYSKKTLSPKNQLEFFSVCCWSLRQWGWKKRDRCDATVCMGQFSQYLPDYAWLKA